MNWGPAWTPLAADEHERYWRAFDGRFRFSPDVRATKPAIVEPPGSVTLSLALGTPEVDSSGLVAAGSAAVNAEVLRAFVATFDHRQPLIALDWQHPGYLFRPHTHAVSGEPWRITP